MSACCDIFAAIVKAVKKNIEMAQKSSILTKVERKDLASFEVPRRYNIENFPIQYALHIVCGLHSRLDM